MPHLKRLFQNSKQKIENTSAFKIFHQVSVWVVAVALRLVALRLVALSRVLPGLIPLTSAILKGLQRRSGYLKAQILTLKEPGP